MAVLGRVLLWTVAIVAPGGFLLVPVLAAQAFRRRAAALSALPAPVPPSV